VGALDGMTAGDGMVVVFVRRVDRVATARAIESHP
jgi:hypothetical protein